MSQQETKVFEFFGVMLFFTWILSMVDAFGLVTMAWWQIALPFFGPLACLLFCICWVVTASVLRGALVRLALIQEEE